MSAEALEKFSFEVLKFLAEHFTPWNIHTFNDSHTSELSQILHAHFTKEELLEVESDLRQCFLQFFNKMGRINIKILGLENITITTSLRESTQKTFTVLQQVQKHFEVGKSSNLIVISETLTKKIHSALKTGPDIFREDVKATLPHVIDIGSSYAILFAKSRIAIRTKLNEEGSEKRFMGLPEEDLEEISKANFKDLDTEIPELLKGFLAKNFNFAVMTNEKFETTHIGILQEGLIHVVRKRCRQDEKATKGLVNYILRLQFENLHKAIAELLLNYIIDNNSKAEHFLKYFTQGKVRINGIKFLLPSLTDTNKQLWSYANITNITLQYRNFVHTMQEKGKLVDHMDKILDTINKKISTAQIIFKKAEQKEISNKALLHETAEKIRTIRHAFQEKGKGMSQEKKASLNRSLKLLGNQESDYLLKQRECERDLGIKQKAHSDLIYKQSFTLERHGLEIDNLEEMSRAHKEIQQKYELMLSAVTHALLGKKKEIN